MNTNTETTGAGVAVPARIRHLVVVLGDQLDADSAAFDGFDPQQDCIWMAEVAEESTHVWSSRIRIVMFLAAMRHFAESLRARGWPVLYRELPDGSGQASAGDSAMTPAAAMAADETLASQLTATLRLHAVERVRWVQPGDWRVQQALRAAVGTLALDELDDRHFLSTPREFAAHASGRRQLRMEFFYREMRRRHGVLMDTAEDGSEQPAGGQWNFDADNREAFGAAGPGTVPPTPRFAPDTITRAVIARVQTRFVDHPGNLDDFGWPVTRAQALQVLQSFITERLPHFGRHQDAIWAGEPWLFHAHLSAALNLKLLNPREVVAAAEQAWRDGAAPLAAVEGFIRQILGWREYVRGIYWLKMPQYAELNSLGADGALPAWYWTGETQMACLREAIGQTLRLGYAHHIQRLMVTGLYALLRGVAPQQVHGWYLAVYVDAVEWVELPNTLGMSQYADGGLMASKPYAATGQYIARMSNHCSGCRFDPKKRTGEKACPFTTLYWDFLMRHEKRLAANPRMALQVKNLARIAPAEATAIRERAEAIRADAAGTF